MVKFEHFYEIELFWMIDKKLFVIESIKWDDLLQIHGKRSRVGIVG